MNITCYRLVPLGGALQAAGQHIDAETRDPEFSAWFTEFRFGHLRGFADAASLTADMVEETLPGVPRTPAGAAWASEARAALDRTRADVWRPFDSAVIDINDERMTTLYDLADLAEDLSPMTACLADGIRDLITPKGNTIGNYAAMLDRLTETHFIIRDATEHSPAQRVSWPHIIHLAPHLRFRLTGLIADLVSDLPETGENDGGAFRRGPWA